MVVGPGLGRDPLTLGAVAEVVAAVRRRGLPMVVDADGLWLANQQPELVQGEGPCRIIAAPSSPQLQRGRCCNPQPARPVVTSTPAGYANTVLTPNAVEFKRLADRLGVDANSPSALSRVAAALGGPIVLRKGGIDAASDGTAGVECDEPGSLRRAGGQGDVLSGCIAVFAAWAQRSAGVPAERLHSGNGGSEGSRGGSDSGASSSLPPLMLAAYGGALVTRRAAARAFKRRRRAMGATDLIEDLGPTVDELLDSS